MTRDQWDAQTAEIARLMDVADNEDAAIQQLEADVAAIRRVHAAKTALRAFTPSELREALDLRRKRHRRRRRDRGRGCSSGSCPCRSCSEPGGQCRPESFDKNRRLRPQGSMRFPIRRPGHQGTLSRSCRWLAVRAPRELRPSLSRWRAPPDAPRGFSNAGGLPPVWQRPVRQSSAHIHRVGGAGYAEMFSSKELAAF